VDYRNIRFQGRQGNFSDPERKHCGALAPPTKLFVSTLRFDKLFTPEEANELIPRLEIIVRDLQAEANVLRQRIADLARSDSKLEAMELAAVLERYPELRPIASRMAEMAGEIEELGGFLKDIDQGLIDFPHKLERADEEDEVVFLCWQYGEQQMVAWHAIEGGFAQRQPLPGASKPLLN
jgi:hypothetical protein